MKLKLLVLIISFLLLSIVLSGCFGGKGHRFVGNVCISPSGEYLISDDGNSVQFWSVATQKELVYNTDEQGYYCWSPSGDYIANNGKIKEFPSMTEIANYSGSFFDWSSNGEIFASMGVVNNTDRSMLEKIELFNTTDFSIINTIFMDDSTSIFSKIKISPNGTKILYYSTSSNSIRVVDTESENITLLYNLDDIENSCDIPGEQSFELYFTWSSDGNFIGVAAKYDNQCWKSFVINSQNGSLIYNVTTMPATRNDAIDFSPSCNKISYCNSHVEIWDLSNGELIKVLSDDAINNL